MTELRNKDEFLNALKNSGIQVMMFTAFWCPDCMYIKPFLPEIEEEFSDLQFYSLKISNLSESPVYPDHVTSVEGLRYLRAPPVV